MLTAIVVMKTIIFIAGFAVLGQGVLFVLAGASRDTNFFYRILRAITSPALKAVRFITPRKLVPDAYIGAAAFFLMAGIYFALVLEQSERCLSDLTHAACERLVTDLGQRCVAGDNEACNKVGRATGIIGSPAPSGATPTKP
jgi:hypothetical protein